ncbi:MAG: flippase-like domain-containing protein [bacterium]|nr:flippase-like domain-containing protein [bacterium]
MNESANDKPSRTLVQTKSRLFVGLSLSGLCLFLAFRNVSLSDLKEALSNVHWGWVMLTTGTFVLTHFLKSFRWRLFFISPKVKLDRAVEVYFIGQMLNAVFPARAGDVGRIFLIGENQQVSRRWALSTVILEKMVDLLMLCLAYFFVSVWMSQTSMGMPDWLVETGRVLISLSGVSLIVLLAIIFLGPRVWKLLRAGMAPLPQKWQLFADNAAENVITAFEGYGSGRVFLPILGWSLIIWGLMSLTPALLFPAFQLVLSPWVAVFLTVVLITGVAVPPLPGNLGVFAYLCQLVLVIFGVERETALAYGITLQAIVFIPQIVLGLICLLRENGPK